MATQDVNIRVSSNVAEAIQLWKAMESGPQGMANALEGMGKHGKRHTSELNHELNDLLKNFLGIQLGIEGAHKALEKFLDMRKELLEKRTEAAQHVDEQARRLFVQFGGQGDAGKLTKDVLGVAAERHASPEQAFSTASALHAAGFGQGEILGGGGLSAALEVLAAVGQARPDANAREVAKSVAAYINASGSPRTAESIKATGAAVYGLLGHGLNVGDLAGIAPVAAKLGELTGMGGPEVLALTTQLGQQTGADIGTSATGLQFAIANMVKEGKMHMGQPFGDVQQQVSQELAGLPQEKKSAAMLKLLGRRGLLAASLFSPAGIAGSREYSGYGNVEAFEQAAEIAEGGLKAKGELMETGEAQTFYDNGAIDPALARRALVKEMEAAHRWGIARLNATTAFDMTLGWTANPEAAIAAGVNASTMLGQDPAATQRRKESIIGQARADSMEIHIKLTDQNNVAIPHKAEVHNVGKNTANSAGK